MAPPVVRSIAQLTPLWFRRSVAGALVDLRSVPQRLRDPARRNEPFAFLHNVGNGDFRGVGEQLVANLRDHAGLQGSDRVLDIGCGTGRVAAPLAALLAAGGGSYLGFDVSRVGIGYCRRRFARDAHMQFRHIDVWNGDYNPRGRVSELETRFPAADAGIDLAFATSVFTHMRMPAVRRYLAETARVLAPGGRFAFTAFALEPGREASPDLPFRPFDDTSRVIDPNAPEQAIAHRREALEAAVAEAGLALRTFRRGAWCGPAEYDGSQDLFVAVRPAGGP